jgi:hypothetical protein
MRRLLFLCCLCMISGAVGASPKMHTPSAVKDIHSPEGAHIRVLLEKETRAALLEVRGPYRIISLEGKKALSSGNYGKRYVVHAVRDGIRFGEEFPDLKEISIIPTSPQTDLFLNGFQYKGAFHIYLNENRRLTIVNSLPVEKYLRSTLAVKDVALKSKAAQEAYAILQRTRAIDSLKREEALWDVSAKDEGYFGFGVTSGESVLEKAVEMTPFMVLGGDKGEAHAASPSKIQELAQMGLDAKMILESLYPTACLGITPSKRELEMR